MIIRSGEKQSAVNQAKGIAATPVFQDACHRLNLKPLETAREALKAMECPYQVVGLIPRNPAYN